MNAIYARKKIFNTYFIYFMSMSIFCVMKIGLSSGWFHLDSKILDIVYTFVIQLGVLVFVPFTLYLLIQKPQKPKMKNICDDFGLHKTGISVLLISLVIGLIVFVINIAVSSVFAGFLKFVGYQNPFVSSSGSVDTSLAGFFLQILLVAILPAICEEFLHRGFLINGIRNIGPKKAILISGLLFGFLHFNINQFFYATILGFVIGFVGVVSKSIVPCIVIHFTNNALSVYMNYAQYNKWPLHNFNTWLSNIVKNGNSFLVFTICFIVVAALIALLIYLIILIFKITTYNKVKKALMGAFEGDFEKDLQFKMRKQEAWREVMKKSGSLNINYEEMKSPIDLVLPKENLIVKPTTRVNLFLYSSLILGFLITLFTFIWGMI